MTRATVEVSSSLERLSRRDFIFSALAGTGAVAFGGCAAPPKDFDPATPLPQPTGCGHVTIDAHCHVFNGKDLPLAAFLREVIVGGSVPFINAQARLAPYLSDI